MVDTEAPKVRVIIPKIGEAFTYRASPPPEREEPASHTLQELRNQVAGLQSSMPAYIGAPLP